MGTAFSSNRIASLTTRVLLVAGTIVMLPLTACHREETVVARKNVTQPIGTADNLAQNIPYRPVMALAGLWSTSPECIVQKNAPDPSGLERPATSYTLSRKNSMLGDVLSFVTTQTLYSSSDCRAGTEASGWRQTGKVTMADVLVAKDDLILPVDILPAKVEYAAFTNDDLNAHNDATRPTCTVDGAPQLGWQYGEYQDVSRSRCWGWDQAKQLRPLYSIVRFAEDGATLQGGKNTAGHMGTDAASRHVELNSEVTWRRNVNLK